MSELAVNETSIPGLYEVDLDVRRDERGWFKESYQREKLEKLGLPHLEVVQHNVAYSERAGVTRGLHAEPWDKFVSLAAGRAFSAWVDLRAGESWGRVVTLELSPEKAALVPRGVANGYQTLEDGVVYLYLVNAHWSPDVEYRAVDLWDPAVGILWPIGSAEAIVSPKDRTNPPLAQVEPMTFD
ncbi:MAG TPA: dTDP-4-dehydrorhamnose 3,5-epimerase family protein [Acidimicrobiales bacterium]|nr:dTDP-4-dehydrorhamnose 3,5-epimerase family protein [Acidimicrobiales bacterium]